MAASATSSNMRAATLALHLPLTEASCSRARNGLPRRTIDHLPEYRLTPRGASPGHSVPHTCPLESFAWAAQWSKRSCSLHIAGKRLSKPLYPYRPSAILGSGSGSKSIPVKAVTSHSSSPSSLIASAAAAAAAATATSSTHTEEDSRSASSSAATISTPYNVIPTDSSSSSSTTDDGHGRKQRLRVLVAGAGIGGLVFALAAKKKGINVKVFERDVSAIRGEGQYRGPIQIQSNALAALEAIDQDVADEIMLKGTVTGDRINGLVDGLTGEWYVKFDTWNPAVRRGLPVTRVISRMTLQETLARAVGTEIVQGNSTVVDFEDDGEKVTVILDDGTRVEGDVLIGADGIRSKVRTKLLGQTDATYSDYTCYTGIASFVPLDIETVGYRVFLGSKLYFVSSDVGHGKMQWYAFHYEKAGQDDPVGTRKERLLQLFDKWCDGVLELILATPEEMILRRDIYDRIPILTWGKGRVTLLGDSAHAMQPNMGQGGCMAIEDGFELALDIDKAIREVEEGRKATLDMPSVFKKYESERRLRVGAIHGMARMAAIMASTYITYLGGGLSLPWLMSLRIPHPGRVFGKFFMEPTMPFMIDWVLGGYSTNLEGRVPYCRIEDKATANFDRMLKDNDLLERATEADWTLMKVDTKFWWQSLKEEEENNSKDRWVINNPSKPVIMGSSSVNDNSSSSSSSSAQGREEVMIRVPGARIATRQIKFTTENGAVFVEDLPESTGTWLNGSKLWNGMAVRIRPGDVIEMGKDDRHKLKLRVKLQKPVSDKVEAAA